MPPLVPPVTLGDLQSFVTSGFGPAFAYSICAIIVAVAVLAFVMAYAYRERG